MNIASKWFEKSISSFNSGNEYKGIKEFNISLIRLIEKEHYDKIEQNFNTIIPILDSRKLFHETEQIVDKLLKHLKKKKALIIGLKPLYKSITGFLKNNSFPLTSLHAMKSILFFIGIGSDKEITEFISSNYRNLIEDSINYDYLEKLIFVLFKTFVILNEFDIALEIADPKFFDSIENKEHLKYAMYGILLMAIQKDLKYAIEKLQYFRKTISKDLQAEKLFKCVSEFILASLSKDLDWWNELQSHFSELIRKNRQLRILIGQLSDKNFPKSNKSSLFDLFKSI